MPTVTVRRKRPVTVRTLLWDGSNLAEMREFCGRLAPGDWVFTQSEGETARVWNTQEHCDIDVPVGHHVVRGPLGEFYPLSPAALELTYEPVDEADLRLADSEREGAHTRLLEQCADANLTGEAL